MIEKIERNPGLAFTVRVDETVTEACRASDAIAALESGLAGIEVTADAPTGLDLRETKVA